MKYNNNKITAVIIAIAILLANCGKHATVATKELSVINDSLIKTLTTVPVAIEDLSEQVRLNGYIAPNETREAKVYALVSGKISAAFVELGDYVTKGQQLAVLQSTEVAGVGNDLSLAESNVDIARKNMESNEDLYKGGLATERDFINAKLEFNKASSELNKAKQISAITGGSQSRFILKAPISGYVIEKNITNNSEMRDDNNNNLFTIADLSNVWVMANVYETDINNIHIGDAVKVQTLANPDKNYIGKIDKIYNVLDPENRTMKVRVSLDNPNNELKPDMFATISVTGKPSGTKANAIPADATIMNHGKYYVVVKNASSKLAIKEVSIIKKQGDRAFVSGVNEGEQIVTSSQVFLYEALNAL